MILRILSLLTLLLYCGLLFPTAAPYVNNKLVELQNNHQLFTFAVQAPAGQASKCLTDQPDDHKTLPARQSWRPLALSWLMAAPRHSADAPRLLYFPFSARAPPVNHN